MAYFILGIVFITFGFPIVDGLAGLILIWIELVKGKMSVKITDYACQIQNLQNSMEESETGYTKSNAIGFVVPTEEEEDEDENF